MASVNTKLDCLDRRLINIENIMQSGGVPGSGPEVLPLPCRSGEAFQRFNDVISSSPAIRDRLVS